MNAINNDGKMVLMLASLLGDTEIVKLLIEKGADVNAVSKTGSTALRLASVYGRTETVKILAETAKAR